MCSCQIVSQILRRYSKTVGGATLLNKSAMVNGHILIMAIFVFFIFTLIIFVGIFICCIVFQLIYGSYTVY